MGKMNLEKKFLALIHVLMCNSTLCIYNNRNPYQISDIMDDSKDWFEDKLPRIQSIVRKVSSKFSNGWIRIDVFLTNPDTPIERWYFINTPLPDDKKPEMTEKCMCKMYYEITLYLRSLYSLLNCMPAKTLSLSLENIPEKSREIRLELVPLSEFPVDEPEVPNAATLEMNQIISPLGSCSIRCVYNTHPEMLIPPIIKKEMVQSPSTTKREYIAPVKSMDLLNDSSEELDKMIRSISQTESIGEITGEVRTMPIEEFAKLASETKFEDKNKTKEEITEQFHVIKGEIDDLLSDWSRSG